MKIKDGKKMYTMRELPKITGFGFKRISQAMEKRLLVPTDIEKSQGRKGFRYLFDEESIIRYAEKIGIEPRWDAVDDEANMNHARAEIKARQETRELLYPQEKEIVINADNVEKVFRQIQGEKKEPENVKEEPKVEISEEATDMYVVKLGKAFITTTKELSINFDSKCWMEKPSAETLIKLFGGKLMQIFVRDADGR